MFWCLVTQEAVTTAEAAYRSAAEEVVKVLGEEEESDDDDESHRHRPKPGPPVSEDEIRELESVARKTRKASGTRDQVSDGERKKCDDISSSRPCGSSHFGEIGCMEKEKKKAWLTMVTKNKYGF